MHAIITLILFIEEDTHLLWGFDVAHPFLIIYQEGQHQTSCPILILEVWVWYFQHKWGQLCDKWILWLLEFNESWAYFFQVWILHGHLPKDVNSVLRHQVHTPLSKVYQFFLLPTVEIQTHALLKSHAHVSKELSCNLGIVSEVTFFRKYIKLLTWQINNGKLSL